MLQLETQLPAGELRRIKLVKGLPLCYKAFMIRARNEVIAVLRCLKLLVTVRQGHEGPEGHEQSSSESDVREVKMHITIAVGKHLYYCAHAS